jgi:hypothetical protein
MATIGDYEVFCPGRGSLRSTDVDEAMFAAKCIAKLFPECEVQVNDLRECIMLWCSLDDQQAQEMASAWKRQSAD